MADDNVTVSVAGEAGGATDALKDVANSVKELQSSVASITEGVSSFKEEFIKAFTVEKVLEFIESMTAAATQVERLTTALGVTATMVDTFDVAGRAAGVSVSAMSEGMTRLETTISRASGGIERSKDALASLGLTYKDFNGLDTTGKLDLLATKLSVLRDSTTKTAIAQQLLGGAASALLPILNQGAGAFQQYNAIVERAGSAATPQFLEEMSRLDLSIIEVQKSFSGLGQSVITAFAPALSGTAKIISDMVEAMNNSIKSGGTLATVLNTLVIAVQALATAAAVSVAFIETLWEVIKTGVYAAGEGIMVLGKIIKDNLFTFNFSAATADWNNYLDGLAARNKITAANMAPIMKNMTDELKTIWNQAASDKEKIDQTQDANMKRRNQDAISAALARANNEIAIEKDALKQKTALLDMEVAAGKITQNQKFAALEQYTEQAYQAELKTLQGEAAIGGLSVSQQSAIFDKIKLLKQTHETEMVNLDKQSLQTQVTQWKQYTDAVSSAFNAQLQGLLTGQTTFTQAMKNILLQLSVQVIELLVTKPLSAYVAGQLAQLTATQSGAAAKAAAEVAGAEAALPAKIAAFTSDLTARAALTFAGIMANLSPLLGPAAAGPAAAGEATVMAQMAAVPKFDVGTWAVPRTQLAMVHKDEVILPAGAPSDAYRAAASGGGIGGGGGNPLQINIHALDAGSFKTWLQGGGAKQMAVAVSNYQNKNPSSRPSR